MRFTKGWFLPAVILAPGAWRRDAGAPPRARSAACPAGPSAISSATEGATARPPAGETPTDPDPDADHPGRGARDRDRDRHGDRDRPPTESAASPRRPRRRALPPREAARHQPALAVDPARRAVLAGLIAWIVHVGPPPFGDRRRLAVPAHRRVRQGLGPARRDERGGSAGDMGAATPAPGGADIQRRADDLTQEPTRCARRSRTSRPRIADTLASLQAARSAMDAERAPAAPTGAGRGRPRPAVLLRDVPPRAPRQQ